MNLLDLVTQCRTYRRFYQDHPVSLETLRELIALARLTPSAANLQPLRYALSCTPEKNAAIFDTLAWAGYLPEWPGPEEGERPSAYIVILHDKTISDDPCGCDHGIAAQTIMLGAVEKGLGGCMFGSIKRGPLLELLKLDPKQYEIKLVLALGKPKEQVVIDPVKEDGDIRYWRDAEQVHHVPKRALDDLIVG